MDTMGPPPGPDTIMASPWGPTGKPRAPIMMDCADMRGVLCGLGLGAGEEEGGSVGQEAEMDLLMRDTEIESRIASILLRILLIVFESLLLGFIRRSLGFFRLSLNFPLS